MKPADFRRVLEAIEEAVLLVDCRAHVLWANKVLLRDHEARGLTIKVQGCTLAELYGSTDSVNRIQEAVAAASPVRFDMRERINAHDRVTEIVCRPLGAARSAKEFLILMRDVTESRRAMESVRKEAAGWVEVFGALSVGVCVLDADGLIERHNAAALRLSGLDRSLNGLPCWELLNPVPEAVGTCPFARMKVSQRCEHSEVYVRNRWLRIAMHPILDTDDSVARAVLVMEDVSDRVTAEQALREVSWRLDALIQELPDPVYFKDRQGRNLIFNKAFEAIVGLPAKQIEGRKDDELFPRHLAQQCAGTDEEVWSGSQTVVSEEVLEGRNGARRVFSSRKAPILDAEQRVIGLVGVSRDITAHKETEESLRQRERELARSEAFLDGIIEQSPTPMLITDAKGNVLRVNEACRLALAMGIPDEDGRPYNVFNDPVFKRKGLTAKLRPVYETGATVRFVVDYAPVPWTGMGASARETPILDVTFTGVEDATGCVVLAVCQFVDISEQSRARDAELRVEMQRRQEQKLEAIATLAVGVARGIQEPVEQIIKAVKRLSATEGDAIPGETLHQVGSEAEAVARVVHSLLALGRRGDEPYARIRLADAVEEIVPLVEGALTREGITLDVNIADDLPPCTCRPGEIRQVLMSLLDNARQAILAVAGYHSRKPRIAIGGEGFHRDGALWLRLTVADSGDGIPSEIMERVFDPFFTTKSREAHAGLGLSVARGIVHEHRGVMRTESQPGHSCRVHVEVPVIEETGRR